MGRHLCVADRDDPDLQGQLDQAEDDANNAEYRSSELEDAVEYAISVLDGLDYTDAGNVISTPIYALIERLEKVVGA